MHMHFCIGGDDFRSRAAQGNDPTPANADAKTPPAAKEEKQVTKDETAQPAGGAAAVVAAAQAAEAAKPKYPPHATVLKDAKPITGLIPLYWKENHLYAELSSSHFNKDFIVVSAIAKGIGQPLVGGTTLMELDGASANDWVWQFRKVDDQVRIIRRNVRFTANSGSPEEKAVKLAYTDSVLYSLPTVTTGPNGGTVIDLAQVFMSDLPQLGQRLPGFSFASNKSNFSAVKGFAENMEIQVAATYASSGFFTLDSVPDSRGATINIHYSISALPQTGYRAAIGR